MLLTFLEDVVGIAFEGELVINDGMEVLVFSRLSGHLTEEQGGWWRSALNL